MTPTIVIILYFVGWITLIAAVWRLAYEDPYWTTGTVLEYIAYATVFGWLWPILLGLVPVIVILYLTYKCVSKLMLPIILKLAPKGKT